jgi:SAM-dependent methyltransferase
LTTDPIKRDTGAGWDAMSDSYQHDSDISLDDVHYGPFAMGERELNLLGPVDGKRILELACGAAQNSIALSKWGAKCVGVDISPKQLRQATIYRDQESVDVALIRGDMEHPSMFVPGTFDIVLSSFGWEFIPDLAACFKACNELLKPGGTLLVCTAHPLNAFDWDEKEGAVMVTDFFNPPVEVWDDPVPDGHRPGMTFFRTFSEMFALLTGAGFSVERVLEPFPQYLSNDLDPENSNPPYAGSYWNSSRERLSKVPFAIVYLASKQA